MSMKLKIDTTDMEQALHNLDTVKDFMKDFKEQARHLIMYRLIWNIPRGETGKLGASVGSENTEEGFVVFVRASYALFVEKGTGMFGESPHLIYPKTKKALRFKIGGTIIFAKYVIGQPGQFFVKRTREEMRPIIRRVASDLWRKHHHV